MGGVRGGPVTEALVVSTRCWRFHTRLNRPLKTTDEIRWHPTVLDAGLPGAPTP